MFTRSLGTWLSETLPTMGMGRMLGKWDGRKADLLYIQGAWGGSGRLQEGEERGTRRRTLTHSQAPARGTPLVRTLSACQAGDGREAERGLEGMSRARWSGITA